MTDFERDMLNATWVVAGGTAALAVLALWGESIRRFFYRPSLLLNVNDPDGEVTNIGAVIKSRWFHVKVSASNRRIPFHNVGAYLTEVQMLHPSGEWQTEWKGRAQLQWKGEDPAYVGLLSTKTVGPDWEADLFYIAEDSPQLVLNTQLMPNNLSRTWPRDQSPGPISIRFVVQARGNEGESEPTTFEVHWKRNWENTTSNNRNPVVFKKLVPPPPNSR